MVDTCENLTEHGIAVLVRFQQEQRLLDDLLGRAQVAAFGVNEQLGFDVATQQHQQLALVGFHQRVRLVRGFELVREGREFAVDIRHVLLLLHPSWVVFGTCLAFGFVGCRLRLVSHGVGSSCRRVRVSVDAERHHAKVRLCRLVGGRSVQPVVCVGVRLAAACCGG